MLLGEHEHTIDDKSRLTLPAKFRQAMAGGIVLTRGLDACVEAYPADDWQALVESSLRYGVGVSVDLEPLLVRDDVTPFEALFSESTARALVAVPRSEEVRFADLATSRGVQVVRIGVTTDSCVPGAGAGVGCGAKCALHVAPSHQRRCPEPPGSVYHPAGVVDPPVFVITHPSFYRRLDNSGAKKAFRYPTGAG
jgi:hypothetical protein